MTEEVIEAPQRDFYIKLAAESDMAPVFAAFYTQDYVTVVDEEGNETQTPDGDPYLVTHTHDYAIDIVGVIQEPTGNVITDEEGNEIPEMAPIPGHHVNVRLTTEARRDDVEAINAVYGQVPVTPVRVFL
jgi:hypothetical protein